MSPSLDRTTVIILLIITYISLYYLRFLNRQTRLRGPIPFPIVGNLPQLIYYLIKYDFNLDKVICVLSHTHGDFFELHIPFLVSSDPVVVIGNADYTEKIFASHSASGNYTKRVVRRQGLDELGFSQKGVLFNQNIPNWLFNRKFFRDGIVARNVLEENIKTCINSFEELDKAWIEIGSKQNAETEMVAKVNLVDWLLRWSTEIIFQVSIRRKVNAIARYTDSLLSREVKPTILEENNQQQRQINIDTESFIKHVCDFFPTLWLFLTTPKWVRRYFPPVARLAEELKSSMNNLNHDLLKIIQERRIEISRHSKPETEQEKEKLRDFLTMMITINTPWDVTKDNNKDEFDTKPMNDDLIRENLLNALGPGAITGGTQFIIHQVGIHMNPLHWKRPEIFEPARFLASPFNASLATSPEAISDGVPIKNSFLYFGGGSRMCPGRALAINELKAFVTLFYRKYDVELVNPDAKIHWDHVFIRNKLRVMQESASVHILSIA
ncbi:4510_t:CDS:2 [Ambispora gerdemannii]|uniref:4510_t:CDS:1 n=1 Tax=Ambispora gerdemannii TaxID=144530 RepID=A0A9N8ZV90_9GLOM|nr:4510_t:CDS:2 [Ambispora gerdemannii]